MLPVLAFVLAAILVLINNAMNITELVALSLDQRCGNFTFTEFDDATEFDSARIPTMPIYKYLRGYCMHHQTFKYKSKKSIVSVNRIAHFSGCSDECFVLGSIYIERLCKKQKLPLTKQNVHRFIATAVLIATKFHNDYRVKNSGFSRLSGLKLSGMMTHLIQIHSIISIAT